MGGGPSNACNDRIEWSLGERAVRFGETKMVVTPPPQTRSKCTRGEVYSELSADRGKNRRSESGGIVRLGGQQRDSAHRHRGLRRHRGSRPGVRRAVVPTGGHPRGMVKGIESNGVQNVTREHVFCVFRPLPESQQLKARSSGFGGLPHKIQPPPHLIWGGN